MTDGISTFFRYVPTRIVKALVSLPPDLLRRGNEIRLRRGAPVSLTAGDKNVLFDCSGRVCGADGAICASASELAECVSLVAGGSLYTCDEFVSHGYIPLETGGRAGVCGRALVRDGRITGMSEITSISLRLHRNVPDFAQPLIREYAKNGIRGAIVCSPPAMGKTTFLRSACVLLGEGRGIKRRRVGVADERDEIMAGVSQSGLIDVLSGAPKADAIEMLTRTMSPEILVCDEITAAETEALINAQNAGVCLLASAHAASADTLFRRPHIRRLAECGIFSVVAELSRDGGYKCLLREAEELL